MVKIRLMRVGKKKQPIWRVVVADSRSPRDGRIIESIGHYQPRQEPSLVNIDNERALYWLQRGAQPSEAVRHLLQISGAWTDFTGEPPKTLPDQPGGGGVDTPAKSTKPRKATPAASVTAAEDAGEVDEAAELPEAVDQQEAAPEADTDDAS